MGATKKILVTMKVVEIEVPEEATTPEIHEILDAEFGPDRRWSTWTYEEDWRN